MATVTPSSNTRTPNPANHIKTTSSTAPAPHPVDILKGGRHQVIQIISAAEARGQQRLAEMNRQVLGNLDQIIATLETPADKKGTGAADAC